MKVAAVLASLLLLYGAYLAFKYRSAELLHENATKILAWEAAHDSRAITRQELQEFPEPARGIIFSQCYGEGGRPRRSCYQEAAAWMSEKASEHEERNAIGLVLIGLGSLLGASAYFITRRQRRLSDLMASGTAVTKQ